MDLSYRQLQRLITRFIQQGAASLAHGNRGKPSSNRVNESVKVQALELIHQYYSDFGPTLAHEKLQGLHNVSVSLETLRQWMIADGLWVPHSKRKPRVYQPLIDGTVSVNSFRWMTHTMIGSKAAAINVAYWVFINRRIVHEEQYPQVLKPYIKLRCD